MSSCSNLFLLPWVCILCATTLTICSATDSSAQLPSEKMAVLFRLTYLLPILFLAAITMPTPHYFELKEAGQSVNITCNRTCGSDYRDIWKVLIHNAGTNESETWRVNDEHEVLRKEQHPEFDIQAYVTPDPLHCNEDQTVPSIMNIRLASKTVTSTSESIIVACGLQFQLETLYPAFSAVVDLPLRDVAPAPCTPTPTSTTVTAAPTASTGKPFFFFPSLVTYIHFGLAETLYENCTSNSLHFTGPMITLIIGVATASGVGTVLVMLVIYCTCVRRGSKGNQLERNLEAQPQPHRNNYLNHSLVTPVGDIQKAAVYNPPRR